MIAIASLLLAIVLYGQLSFNALTYYFQISNPSWPIWISLFAVTALIASQNIRKLNIHFYDLFFGILISYIILNFAILGESSSREFAYRMAAICLIPYICGRILGAHLGLSLFRSMQFMALFYVIIVAIELIKTPALLLENDRLLLFAMDGDFTDDGNSTAYNIGLNLGSLWVASFALLSAPVYLLIEKIKISLATKTTLLFSVFAVPLIILTMGSRSSLASMFATAAVLILASAKIPWKKVLIFLIGTVALLAISYSFLPESRLELLNQAVLLPKMIGYGSETDYCTLTGDSITARATLLREALHLFSDSPFFGVGAGNYGLKYCGPQDEFVSPHSIIAQIAVEFGIVGLVIFGILIFILIRKYFQRMKSQKHTDLLQLRLIFSLWLFIVFQIQITGNIYYDYHFFLLTGLFASCLQNLNSEEIA